MSVPPPFDPSLPEPSVPLDDAAALRVRVDELERRLARSEERYGWIHEFGAALAEIHHPEAIVPAVMPRIARIMNAGRARLYLWDEAQDLDHLFCREESAGTVREVRVRVGEGLVGWVAANGRSLNLKDATRDARFEPTVEPGDEPTTSALCQPFRARDQRVVGVIEVVNKVSGYFTPDDETLLSALARALEIVFENLRLVQTLQDRNRELVAAQRRLQEQVQRLDLLSAIQSHVGQADAIDEVVEAIATGAARAIESEAVAVTLCDDGEQREWVFERDPGSGSGFRPAIRRWDALVRDEVILTAAPLSRGSVTCSTAAVGVGTVLDPAPPPVSVCAVPLLDGDRCIGSIELVNRRNDVGGAARSYRREDEQILLLVADKVSELVARAVARKRAATTERLSAIGTMLAGVVHDMKTPLSIAGGYVQLMARSPDSSKRADYSERVREQFKHIDQMNRELLAYARGESAMYVRTVQVGSFVEQCASMLRDDMAPHGVQVVASTQWAGQASFDEGKIKRVLFNLARNAREAMAGGGTFTIEARREGRDLVFVCSDTGPGIPDALRDRIFDAFVSTRSTANSGLGLAIVRRFVEDHEGTIEVQSAPGGGAQFVVRLPLDGPRSAEPPRESVGLGVAH